MPVTNGPREIVVGDLDGDGDIDFLAANYSVNNVTVALNNGNGTFVTSSAAVGTTPRGLAAGDLDGDGDVDFVSANYNANNLTVMLNNGHGVFAAAIGSPLASGTRPVAVTLGDFDGDNRLDIAVTSNSTDTVDIYLNTGSGTFAPFTTATTGVGPRGIASGDIDRDGDVDLVVDNFGANTVGILLNDGHGNFTAEASSPYAVGVSPGGVVAGDCNKDGMLDLATANFGSGTAGVLLNTTQLLVGTPGADSFTPSTNQVIHALGGTDTITFSFRLVDATFTYQDDVIIIDGPSLHTVISGFEKFVFTDGTVDNRDGSPLIDDLFYYSRNHDVWAAHVDADTHFNTFGWKEGRDPNALFDTNGYLNVYADVRAAGVNPLTHYDQFGFKEGRDPSKQLDTAQYLSHNGDVAAVHFDPLAHFLENGREEGRAPFNDGHFG